MAEMDADLPQLCIPLRAQQCGSGDGGESKA